MRIKLTLSEKLEDLIAKKGKKASVIADEIKISESMISKYRNDKQPTLDSLVKLAKYFNVSTDYLLGLTDAPASEPNKRNAEEYLSLSDNAISCLREFFCSIRYSASEREMGDWFLASIWFPRLIHTLSEYETACYAEKRVTINQDIPTSRIIVEDGTVKQETMQRKTAKLELVETVLQIAEIINQGAMEAADNGKL